MEGIQILNVIERTDMTPMGICFGIAMFVFWLAIMIFLASDKYKAVIVCFVLMLVCGAVMFHPSMEVKTKLYEAIINDTVSFAELNDNYNIVEQRGSIFVLEEKEANEN